MLIEIARVLVNERIRKDFGDIDELAEDIRCNGLINPPVVTPELALIAGERRLRACKSLGWQQIEVRVMTVRDYEHQLRMEISENENRKEFTFSERVDWARRLERVEREKAEERKKETLKQNVTDVENLPQRDAALGKTRDIVAEVSGFGSGKQYEKAKYVSENADPETIAKLDAGEISIHKAWKETKEKLTQVQEELALARDGIIFHKTRAETFQKEVQRLKAQPPKVETIIETKEVSIIPEYIERQLDEQSETIETLRQEKEAMAVEMKTLQERDPDVDTQNRISELLEALEAHEEQITTLKTQQTVDSLTGEFMAFHIAALANLQNGSADRDKLAQALAEMNEFSAKMRKALDGTLVMDNVVRPATWKRDERKEAK